MANPRQLNLLRLKYEHSVATCRLCGCKGIVGEDLKIADAGQPGNSPDLSSGLFIRCADPIACQRRAKRHQP